MRYPLEISHPWQGLFWLLGFSVDSSYVEVDGEALHLHFGTANECIPLPEIAKVLPAARRDHPA